MSSKDDIWKDGIINDNIKFKLANNTSSAGLGSLDTNRFRSKIKASGNNVDQIGKQSDLHILLIKPAIIMTSGDYTSQSVDISGIKNIDFFGNHPDGNFQFEVQISGDGIDFYTYREDGNIVYLETVVPGDFAQSFSFESRFVRLKHASGPTTNFEIYLSGKS